MTLYTAHASTLHGPDFLGVATGTIEDIEAYFSDQSQYGLTVTPAQVVNVPEGYAQERRYLVQELADLQSRVDKLNAKLDSRE